jgi:hypothetical protein
LTYRGTPNIPNPTFHVTPHRGSMITAERPWLCQLKSAPLLLTHASCWVLRRYEFSFTVVGCSRGIKATGKHGLCRSNTYARTSRCSERWNIYSTVMLLGTNGVLVCRRHDIR